MQRDEQRLWRTDGRALELPAIVIQKPRRLSKARKTTTRLFQGRRLTSSLQLRDVHSPDSPGTPLSLSPSLASALQNIVLRHTRGRHGLRRLPDLSAGDSDRTADATRQASPGIDYGCRAPVDANLAATSHRQRILNYYSRTCGLLGGHSWVNKSWLMMRTM